MSDDTITTCGQGLAAHAHLPEKLAELMHALARTLEVHEHSLDPNEENGRAERDGYALVAAHIREAAEKLGVAAASMKASHDLPMGAHDEAILRNKQMAVFAEFVKAEREVVEMLARDVERDEAMLG